MSFIDDNNGNNAYRFLEHQIKHDYIIDKNEG